MNSFEAMADLAKKGKDASAAMNSATSHAKNYMLEALSRILGSERQAILQANAMDLAKAQDAGLDAARLDRLTLSDAVIDDMKQACLHVASMSDPIGALEEQWMRPNGILVGKMRIPLGLIAMIYESRPNVTIDAAILCLKAGNSVILRGGKEALHSNKALVHCLATALEQAHLPKDAVQFVEIPDHEAVTALCHLDDYIDVMIPRGGENLVRAVTREARMPVLKHFKGVCHAYIDSDCDNTMAEEIIFNAKVQRPGVCNALECLLIHEHKAQEILPKLLQRMPMVSFLCCERSYPFLSSSAKARLCKDEEMYGIEFHALTLAVRVVGSLDEALAHIQRYSSKHTDVIITNNLEHSQRFVREVDSSMVGVNVSTRFNDGGQLGLGAEIGISTSKLHAFGPMGVRELTTTKFVVLGQGQVRGA